MTVRRQPKHRSGISNFVASKLNATPANDKDAHIEKLNAIALGLQDLCDRQARRIAKMEAAIESVSFHYWNCLGDCPKFKPEMANLAALIKYDDGCGNEYLSETTK